MLQLSLLFLTASLLLILWGFINTAISRNLQWPAKEPNSCRFHKGDFFKPSLISLLQQRLTGFLRQSFLKALKQHLYFSILFLSITHPFVGHLYPAFRTTSYGRKRSAASLWMEFKNLRFLQNCQNVNVSSRYTDCQRRAEGSWLEKHYWMYVLYRMLPQYISMNK